MLWLYWLILCCLWFSTGDAQLHGKDGTNLVERIILSNRVSDMPNLTDTFCIGYGNPLPSPPLVNAKCAVDWRRLTNSICGKIFNPTVNSSEYDEFDKKIGLMTLDATGKMPSGIRRGNMIYAGAFHECRRLEYQEYTAGYCRLYVKNGDNSSGMMIGRDICIPKSCTAMDLMQLFKSNVPSMSTISCSYELGRSKDWKTWTVSSIMAFICIVCILASLYDYFFVTSNSEYDQHEYGSLPIRLLLAFSFYSNISRLFITGGKAAKIGQIGPVHFIRFMAMCMVIMGHCFIVNLALAGNRLDMIEAARNTLMEVINNVYLAIDSFFFLSGLLMAFVWFEQFKDQPKRTMSIRSWIFFYLHRFIRLSPPYYMVILFYSFVVTTWTRDQAIFMNPAPKSNDVCEKYWWTDLIYLNNFIHYKEQCYTISWYLATDMQIFLFTPVLVLIPLAIRPIFGFVSSGLVLLVSTLVNVITVVHYHFAPRPMDSTGLGYHDPHVNDIQQYNLLIYSAPWIRCQIYVMGMLIGYYLKTSRRPFRIGWMLNVSLWCASVAVMLAVLLGLHDWTNDYHMPLAWRAIYSALSKLAWGTGLAWIVVACFYGYGGPIDRFMSWNIWVPLGRLTYCAYLNYTWVILLMTGMKDSTIYWSGFVDMAIQSIIPAIVLTYFVSIFWSATFEISFSKAESILFGQVRRRMGKTFPENNDTVVMPVLVNNGLINNDGDKGR